MQTNNDIKATINLIDHVRSDLGPPRKEDREQAQWLCPFHADKDTPSLTVWKDHFYCFGCAVHGDVFDWEMKRTGCDFRAAYHALTEAVYLTGEDKPMTNRQRSTPPAAGVEKKSPPANDWQDGAVQVIRDCYVDLWESDEAKLARAWLAARGLQQEALQKRWIGFNHPAQQRHGHWLERGIVIPQFYESAGTVWGIKIRKSDKADPPKYIHVKGSIPYLYGVETLDGFDKAFVCEGEFDAVLLHQFIGDQAGVVTFGSSTNHDVDTWLEYLMPIKRLYIATDNDEAGEKAWQFWKERTKRARRCVPPMNAKDITDAWKLKVDLREWALGEMLK